MTFSSFNIVYDAGVIGPAWSLEDALEIAGDLVMSGFQVSLITQGADIILDIDELDTRLLDIQMPQASFEALQRPRGEVGWMLLE
jgi:hypothetical protein